MNDQSSFSPGLYLILDSWVTVFLSFPFFFGGVFALFKTGLIFSSTQKASPRSPFTFFVRRPPF